MASLGDHGIARLPHLGHAFGTKFLYFCSATSSQPALILDRLVARWLRENAGLPLSELRWSVSTYVPYPEIMFGWADELALAADELELRIFSSRPGGSVIANGLRAGYNSDRGCARLVAWSSDGLDGPQARLWRRPCDIVDEYLREDRPR
jgi:hypothetical protein